MMCGISLGLSAQDDGLQNLDIDELVAVDLEKASLPIKVDSVKAVSGNTINLGLILPMSKFDEFSKELIQGGQLAIDEINKSGKILNKELYLIPADDAAESSFAVEKAKQLTKNYKSSGIIGPTSSSRFIQVVNNTLPENPVVIISPSATSIEISDLKDNDLAFRTAASDALQGKTAATYSSGNLGHKTAVIFYIDDIYGKGLAQEFKRNFEEAGGQILAEERYSPLVNLTHYDVAPKLGELLKNKPEVLYLVSNSVDIINISHRIDSAQLFKDYRPTIIGSDAMIGDQVTEKANMKALEGMYGTSVKSLRNTYFEEKYKARYGENPAYEETADVYDIVYLFALAIMESKSTDPKLISKHLRNISASGKKVTAKDLETIKNLIDAGKDVDYDGVNSSLDFDKHGDVPDREYQIWQVTDGKFKDNVDVIKMK